MYKTVDFWTTKEGKRLIKEDRVRKLRDYRLRIKQRYNVTKRNNPSMFITLMEAFDNESRGTSSVQ